MGYIPNRAAPELQRTVEAVVRKDIPPNFYDYALYSAGHLISSTVFGEARRTRKSGLRHSMILPI